MNNKMGYCEKSTSLKEEILSRRKIVHLRICWKQITKQKKQIDMKV